MSGNIHSFHVYQEEVSKKKVNVKVKIKMFCNTMQREAGLSVLVRMYNFSKSIIRPAVWSLILTI